MTVAMHIVYAKAETPQGNFRCLWKMGKVTPERTALLVIDLQNDFVAKGAVLEVPAARALIPQIKKLLSFCRDKGVTVIYTTHVHRMDGSDMGPMKELYPPIADHKVLVDGTRGVEIYPEVAPQKDEIVVKKHRYSAFYNTDLDTILKGKGIDTVVICGTTTENCCHSAARDAMYRNYRVIFLSDGTATYDYPDIGLGPIPNAEVHRVTLTIIGASDACVMTIGDFMSRIDNK
jgi:ureidoacrylate peracid hydrolase